MARARQLMLAGAAATVAVVVATTAGFLAGSRGSDTSTTRLSLAACGLVPSPAPLELPLAMLLGHDGGTAVTLGPILHPGLDTPLSLRLVPVAPGEAERPAEIGETLVIPIDRDRLPDELRLSCRYGAVALVEYRRGPLREMVEVAFRDRNHPPAKAVTPYDGGPSAARYPEPDSTALAPDPQG